MAYSQSYTNRGIFAHIRAYFSIFRHIQGPGISGSNIVNQHLLFKLVSSFKSLLKNLFGTFFHFYIKSKHSIFFSSGQYNNNNKMLRYSHKHATHVSTLTRKYATHASTPPMQAHHQNKYINHAKKKSTAISQTHYWIIASLKRQWKYNINGEQQFEVWSTLQNLRVHLSSY